jgi:hypothetical protein
MSKAVAIDPIGAALADVTTAARARPDASRLALEQAWNGAQTDNEWLIFRRPGVAAEPDSRGAATALINHALEIASHRQKPAWNMAEALLCAGA